MIFNYEFPWTEKTEWTLPDGEEMFQNQFKILDEQIDLVLSYTPRRRVCVQAGGAFGLYPLRLADYFDMVKTFEPHLTNWQCLNDNVDGRKNISVTYGALWSDNQSLWMDYSKPKLNSFGAHHVVPKKNQGFAVQGIRLDGYCPQWEIDLLWLDVEGAEAPAILGAIELIRMNQPTVVIEERKLPGMEKMGTRSGRAREILMKNGYKQVATTHGDVVFMPK